MVLAMIELKMISFAKFVFFRILSLLTGKAAAPKLCIAPQFPLKDDRLLNSAHLEQ